MNDFYLMLKNISIKIPKSNKYLFKNFNMNIPTNANVIGLLGSNGVGKSLLANSILGLNKIESGTIEFNEINLAKIKTSKRIKYISLMFQMVNSVFTRQNVIEELRITLKMKNKVEKSKMNVVNELNVLKDQYFNLIDQNPFLLSGGEKRKLLFTLINIMDPSIYILDEPTNGLDANHINKLLIDINNLVKKNKKIIIITHDLKFLSMISDYIVVLEREKSLNIAKIAYQGSFKKYLLNYDQYSNDYLTIPIELQIFRKLIKDNSIDFNTNIGDIWTNPELFIKNGRLFE